MTVTVYLAGGVKLIGTVTGFDQYTVLLRRGSMTQLLFKHAMATVSPDKPVKLYEPDAEPAEAKAGDGDDSWRSI